MPKILINYEVKSTKNNAVNKKTKGILKDNKLSFNDDDCSMSVLINDDELTILRNSEEATLELYFKENIMLSGKYVLKKHNMVLDIKTYTTKMIVEDKKITLEYKLYIDEELTDNFNFKLNWEVQG